MTVVLVVLGALLIVAGAAGALNVWSTRERIHRINRSRPPGDRARSVPGITLWCVASVAVGVLLVAQGVS